MEGSRALKEAARTDRADHELARTMTLLRDTLVVRGSKTDEAREKVFGKIHEQTQKSLLEWTDATASLESVNDVEIFMATGYNLEFMKQHRVVKELLDASQQLGGELSISDIYDLLKIGHDGEDGGGIEVTARIDDDGLISTNDQNGYIKRVDLYDMMHLNKILDFWALQHPEDQAASGLTKHEVERRFWADEAIPFEVTFRNDAGEPATVEGATGYLIKDLREHRARIPRRKMPKEQFEAYYDTIEESQTSFQWLSNLRDPSIIGHHAENGGHAQLLPGVGGEFLYVPVNGKMAADYVRADVRKTTVRHRAQGHPHEIGYYEENTGTCVGFEKEAYLTWRSGVTDYRAHESTTERTMRNMLAMNSGESTMMDKQSRTFWFGMQKKDGQTKKGLIYKAMSSHYDEKMILARGYGITEQEAGDKIMTDVIGKVFALNQRDFLMSVAKVSDGMYDTRDIFIHLEKEDNKGFPRMVFQAKRPKRQETLTKTTTYQSGMEVDFGEIVVEGPTAFARYINWRIAMGDIPEVTQQIDENFVQSLKGESKKLEEDKDSLDLVQDRMEEVLDAAVGGLAPQRLNDFIAGKLTSVEVVVNGASKVIRDRAELVALIRTAMESDENIAEIVRTMTQEDDTQKAIELFLGMIADVRENAPDIEGRLDHSEDAQNIAALLKDLFGPAATDFLNMLAQQRDSISIAQEGQDILLSSLDEVKVFIMHQLGAYRDEQGNYVDIPELLSTDDSLEGMSDEEKKKKSLTPEQKRRRDIIEQITGDRAPTKAALKFGDILTSIMTGNNKFTPEALYKALS